MERDSRQDLILAGLLALGFHLALLGWRLPGGWVTPSPAAPVNPLVVKLVACRPAAEVWPQKGFRAKSPASAVKVRQSKIRQKARIIRPARVARKQSLPSRQTTPQKTRRRSHLSPAPPAPPALQSSARATAASEASPAPGPPPAQPSRAATGQGLMPSQGSARLGARHVVAQPPRYGYRREPRYPRLAVLRGYEGTVLLRVHILESGRVAAVEIKETSGYGILDKAAREAVRSWRFSPAVIDGKAVTSWVLVPITFRLR